MSEQIEGFIAGQNMNGTDLPIASPWRRLGGEIMDGILTFIAILPGLILFIIGIGSSFDGGTFNGDELVGSAIGGILLMFALGLAFSIYNLCLYPARKETNGQTIGQKIAGIRAARLDGQAFTAGTGFVRNMFGKGIMPNIIIGIIGGITALALGNGSDLIELLLWIAFYCSIFYSGALKQGFWDNIAKTVMLEDTGQAVLIQQGTTSPETSQAVTVNTPPPPAPPTTE